MTLISYQHDIVAIAGDHRFHLAPAIDELPEGDPLKTFVWRMSRSPWNFATAIL